MFVMGSNFLHIQFFFANVGVKKENLNLKDNVEIEKKQQQNVDSTSDPTYNNIQYLYI